jgi:hypothetical protein
VLVEQTNWSTPNQSHNLIIAPKFPGSLISSKATIKPVFSESVVAGILKSAKTLLGVTSALIFFNSASEISVISPKFL